MPRKQSRATRRKVEGVMHEFKHGGLKSGGSGKKVKNPKQAIAIALSEAGVSRRDAAKSRARRAK